MEEIEDDGVYSLLNGDATKRRRTTADDEDNTQNDMDVDRTPSGAIPGRVTAIPKGKGVGKKKAQPKPITARLGEPPLDILKMANTTTITLSITELAQMSTYFRDELKRLITAPRKKRLSKKEKEALAAEEANDQQRASRVGITTAHLDTLISPDVAKSVDAWSRKDKTVRAFGLPITVAKNARTGSSWKIPRDEALADQGSDVNLIYPGLREHLDLTLRPLSDLIPGRVHLYMNTADGGKQSLKHWVTFHVKVANISREVWAFACPNPGSNISVLLGIPYLEDVDAKIHVRNETIEVGDISKGEVVIKLRAPRSEHVAPKLHAEVDAGKSGGKLPMKATVEDDSDTEDEEEDWDSESDSNSDSSEDF